MTSDSSSASSSSAIPPKPTKRALPTSRIWAPVPIVSKFFRTIHAKNGEWLFLVPFVSLAAIIIFKTDSVLPNYSAVVGGDHVIPVGNRAPDALGSYRLEPIVDDKTGKVIAMRKISNQQPGSAAAAPASSASVALGKREIQH